MRFKRIFLLAPILASSLVIGCETNKEVVTGPRSKVTVVFNAGDYTFKQNKSHVLPITISSGVNWTFLKKNLEPKLIDGSNEWIDYPSNVKFNYWKLNGQKIDDIDPVPIFDIDGKTLEADYTVTYDVTLKVGDSHKIKDKDDGEGAATATYKKYTVNKGTSYAALKADKEFAIYKADGTTLADDFKYFVDSGGESIPQSSEENYKFKRNNEELIADYATSEKTENFVTDDWDKFCQAANQGLEFISTTPRGGTGTGGYQEDYVNTSFTFNGKSYTKEANTFIGLKRAVRIGSVDYPVTVIGQDQDYSGNQQCVFTFLFDNLISNNRSFGSSGSSNNYDSSSINTYLNNQFFYSLPTSLRLNLLDVNKFTNTGGGLIKNNDGKEVVNQQIDKTAGTPDRRHKLFIPSLAEMNITKYNEGYHIYTPSGDPIVNVEAEGVGPTHAYNSYYQGFAANTKKSRIKKPIIVDETTGEYTEGDPASYWLRSPDLATANFTWTVNTSGGIDDTPVDVSKCRGVCPGFCVGTEKSKIKVTFDLNGGSWKDGTTDSIDISVNNESTTMANVIAQIPSAKVSTDGSPNGPTSKPNFLGWHNKASGGTTVDTTAIVSASTTVYANYTANTLYSFSSLNNKYEVYPVKFAKSSAATTVLKPSKTYTDNNGVVHKIHGLPKSSEVILTRGTTTLTSGTHYTYDEDSGDIVVKSSAATGDIKVNVKYSSISDNTDWAIINEICKKDEDNQIAGGTAGDIVKQYFDYGDNKTVTINSKNYKVQIIDMAHSGDTFTSGGHTVTAGLTFDFVYVPNESGTYCDNGGGNNFDYLNSNIYTKCNAFFNSSTEIKNYVKTVNKNYMKDNGKKNLPVLGTVSCQYFVPSNVEYGIKEKCYDGMFEQSTLKDLHNKEGSVYKLYENTCSDVTPSDRSELKKYSISSTSTSINYWTRTCVYTYCSNENRDRLRQTQWRSYYSNGKYYVYNCWDKLAKTQYINAYYAPAFCI